MQYPVFFVVNDNKRTINPADGKLFEGIWCQRNGYQCDDPKYATPYYTRKGAVALINKLNRNGGEMECPQWARKATNNAAQKGSYRIVEGFVDINS